MHQFKVLLFAFSLLVMNVNATKLNEIKVVDKDYIMVHFKDGDVKLIDDGIGSHAMENHAEESNFYTVWYGESLDETNAVNTENWIIKSDNDKNFGTDGVNPLEIFRKRKVNGARQYGWNDSVPHNTWGDYYYEFTHEYFIYLKLPFSMQQGKSYTIEINANTNTDVPENTFTYDIYTSKSEAVHVNLVGYTDGDAIKAADLYHWMGDGAGRDYSSFVGNKVYIYDINAQKATEVGTVTFHMSSAREMTEGFHGYDYIKGDVWNADFTGYTTPGTYRLAIEGVGCSEEFEIKPDIYFEPFKVQTQGFYYMRIGEPTTANTPAPRQPQWIPGTSPADCKILITTLDPFDEEWNLVGGDKWDKPDHFDDYLRPGNPENTKAVGGHSDALDWDRHLGHVSIIYDMLLPFILTDGALTDDNLGIPESGNGIPDIIDEAKNEVDFWLTLRYKNGYSHGLSNPDKKNILYQADNTAIAAWANAVNAAMLAECYRINGNTSLLKQYLDSAEVAYTYANGLEDQQLDVEQGIGEDIMRGRDFKMTAAAFLYNLTGNTDYENVIKTESKVNSQTSVINKRDAWNQLWATAAYLKTPQTVHYPKLYDNMKASIIYQAKQMEANWYNKRATRRANANNHGYYPTVQLIHRTIIAHAVVDKQSDKELFLNALTLEADYSLGRNPANMIQMTTASTNLEAKRSVLLAYTTGQDDGVPGLHPGHTPYFNLDDWGASMIMGTPSKLYKQSYPRELDAWPKADVFFNVCFWWAHSEFTPQQTMRGKAALYGYLYGLSKMSGK